MEVGFMTLSSAYIELFIREKKSEGGCPGGNVRIPYYIYGSRSMMVKVTTSRAIYPNDKYFAVIQKSHMCHLGAQMLRPTKEYSIWIDRWQWFRVSAAGMGWCNVGGWGSLSHTLSLCNLRRRGVRLSELFEEGHSKGSYIVLYNLYCIVFHNVTYFSPWRISPHSVTFLNAFSVSSLSGAAPEL